MRLSDKKRDALYDAIREPIMEARIELAGAARDGKPFDADHALFRLESLIWKRALNALEVEAKP